MVVNVLLYGLEKSGKSTIIKSFEKRTFTPGIPFTAQSFYDLTLRDGTKFSITEVGGRKEVRKNVFQFLPHVTAIIFVIDGSHESSFRDVTEELDKIISHPHSVGKPLAILFHKTDIATGSPAMIMEDLNLLNRYDRPHRVFSTTAKKPLLFHDVLFWIHQRIKESMSLLEDKETRHLRIFLFDLLNEHTQGLPLLAILGQLEIISRTGQISYDRDKITALLRHSLTTEEIIYDEHSQIWRITPKGVESLLSKEIVKGDKYEELQALLASDTKLSEVGSKGLSEDDQELIEQFDLDDLANLFEKSGSKKRKKD
jgi:small GTP-binding protein